MSLSSFTSPNAILHLPKAVQFDNAGNASIPPLIFLLTGNPGLVGYYAEYLDLLANSVVTTKSNDSNDSNDSNSNDQDDPSKASHGSTPDRDTLSSDKCVIAGFSLGGFEVELKELDDSHHNDPVQNLLFPFTYTRKDLYSLTDQIELSYVRLVNLCGRLGEHFGRGRHDANGTGIVGHDSGPLRAPIKVILVGHSVGAYIALEMVRMHHERVGSRGDSTRMSRERRMEEKDVTVQGGVEIDIDVDVEIVSAFLLTPTIIDLAKSPSGRMAGPLLSNVPFVPAVMQSFSRGLSRMLPRAYVQWLVQRCTGMRAGGAGLITTVNFLMSKDGVRQALHMAGDELREMGANAWGQEIWGPSIDMGGQDIRGGLGKSSLGNSGISAGDQEGHPWHAPKLFFLFAEQDHWVADITRDHIVDRISARERNDAVGRQEAGYSDSDSNSGSPVVLIDREQGMVHAWCLEQSKFVADITRQWIAQLHIN